MVYVKDLEAWNFSPSILFGKSPKIKFLCGKCGSYNSTRVSMSSRSEVLVLCEHCGEINKTGLRIS